MAVFSYSAKDVQLIIGGYPIAGWQTITITRSVKGFQVVRGIRGKNTRVQNRDNSATISVSLLQTSQTNDVFSKIHDLDLSQGTAVISLTLKDGSGLSVFSSAEAYITGYPVATFSGGFEYRNWEIFCQSTGDYNVAGNSNPSGTLLDSILGGASDLVSGIF